MTRPASTPSSGESSVAVLLAFDADLNLIDWSKGKTRQWLAELEAGEWPEGTTVCGVYDEGRAIKRLWPNEDSD